MRQAAGVIRDYGKVVQGVQEPDTSWQLVRVSAKGEGDVATIHWHSASVHHHKTYTLAAVDYDSTACSPTYTGTFTHCPLQKYHTKLLLAGTVMSCCLSGQGQRMQPYATEQQALC